MNRFSKQIALLLILAMTANVVLASQMSVLMMSDYPIEATETALPCHGDSEETPSFNTDELACCDAGCGACFTGTTIFSGNLMSLIPVHSGSSGKLEVSLLEAHKTNLYRPPILI